jgi:tetratricopeptide (TPR) repeat protein
VVPRARVCDWGTAIGPELGAEMLNEPFGSVLKRLLLVAMRRQIVAAHRASMARDWPEAARLYEAVLRFVPQADDFKVQLGHMYKEMGNLDRAAAEYYDVLSRRPSDDDLHLQIGHLEKLRRNWTLVLYHYAGAVRLNPANADALEELRALGTVEEAGEPEATLTELPPMSPDVMEVYRKFTSSDGAFA